MLEKHRLRLDLPDQPWRNVHPGDNRALPWPQRPGQHRHAHLDAEVNQGNDVQQVVAVVRLVRAGEEKIFARYSRNPRQPVLVEQMLFASVGQRPVNDRLDPRQEAVLKRPQVRMAPNLSLLRDQQAEVGEPVLVGEVLQHHRRRVDCMIDIVDPLVLGRIHTKRMQSGPILARREDLALRQRRGETSGKGNDRQFGRRIHRDRRPGIRTGGERAAHRPARVSPRRPDRLAPECVQAFAQPKAGGTFDAVGSGVLPPRKGERPILDRHRISFERRPETVAACRS